MSPLRFTDVRPVIVVQKDRLIPDDDSPYLIVELQPLGNLMDEEGAPRYIYGQVIGRLPHTEAADALAKAIIDQ